MSRVGDLLVNSTYDRSTDEVASFEKLIGCHGGFGGPQTRPFLMVPEGVDLGDRPLVGGEAINAILRGASATMATTRSEPDGAAGTNAPASGRILPV
jgi:hypothetical protein